MKQSYSNANRAGRRSLTTFHAIEWLLFAGLPSVALAGVVLVTTAPLDGPARSNLGASLLTGVVVGVAVLGLELTLDRRHTEREAETERRRATLEAGNSLASLVAAHIELLWFLLVDRAQSEMHPRAQPAGWKGVQDTQDLQRALMWLAEVMRRNPTWWSSGVNLARADAIYFAASDIAERFEINLEESNLQGLHAARVRAIGQLNNIAERLNELRNTEDASNLSGQADSLAFGDVSPYVPELSLWGNEFYDAVLTTGSPLSLLRGECAWLIDQLRKDKIEVNPAGNPTMESPPAPADYRWGILFESSEIADTAWDMRFADGSWLRRVISIAKSQLPGMFGLGPGRSSTAG